MEIRTFIDAKVNREKAEKYQKIIDGNYNIFINEKEEYNLFNKERFNCFLLKELQILNDEFEKL
jgi:hypothetical protein